MRHVDFSRNGWRFVCQHFEQSVELATLLYITAPYHVRWDSWDRFNLLLKRKYFIKSYSSDTG
jgi:hypothetical protein